MIVCIIGIAMLLIEYSASHIDFGFMPTPEQAMADLQKDYADLEFIAVVHSEDNEHVYDGGRLPAGWIGYKFRFKWSTNLSNSDTITLYPCLYEHTSHEWSGGMILTPHTRKPGWNYVPPNMLSMYHDRCHQ